MQQVLNTQERNRAFLKFLAFFLVTVALVVAAVFFPFKVVPSEQNKKLLLESKRQDKSNDDEDKFVARMSTVNLLFDSLKKPGIDYNLVDRSLVDELNELLKLQSNDNPLYDKLNKELVEKFAALKTERKNNVENQIEIQKLTKQTNDLQRYYDNETKKNNGSSSAQPPGS